VKVVDIHKIILNFDSLSSTHIYPTHWTRLSLVTDGPTTFLFIVNIYSFHRPSLNMLHRCCSSFTHYILAVRSVSIIDDVTLQQSRS
jgi:hypothetical protein